MSAPKYNLKSAVLKSSATTWWGRRGGKASKCSNFSINTVVSKFNLFAINLIARN